MGWDPHVEIIECLGIEGTPEVDVTEDQREMRVQH